MESVESVGVSDEDDEEEGTDNSMNEFLVDDDYNSEEDMDLVPKNTKKFKNNI